MVPITHRPGGYSCVIFNTVMANTVKTKVRNREEV